MYNTLGSPQICHQCAYNNTTPSKLSICNRSSSFAFVKSSPLHYPVDQTLIFFNSVDGMENGEIGDSRWMSYSLRRLQRAPWWKWSGNSSRILEAEADCASHCING